MADPYALQKARKDYATRFSVEGRTFWNTAEQALAEAQRSIYVSPDAAEAALIKLRNGRAVTLVYGFNSVSIEPV